MKTKLTPLFDRVIIEPVAPDEKTASGIILPDTLKQKQYFGKVIAVGKGIKDEPCTTKVDDVVVFGKNYAKEFEFEGRKLIVIKESEILATL